MKKEVLPPEFQRVPSHIAELEAQMRKSGARAHHIYKDPKIIPGHNINSVHDNKQIPEHTEFLYTIKEGAEFGQSIMIGNKIYVFIHDHTSGASINNVPIRSQEKTT